MDTEALRKWSRAIKMQGITRILQWEEVSYLGNLESSMTPLSLSPASDVPSWLTSAAPGICLPAVATLVQVLIPSLCLQPPSPVAFLQEAGGRPCPAAQRTVVLLTADPNKPLLSSFWPPMPATNTSQSPFLPPQSSWLMNMHSSLIKYKHKI